ncbi:MAG: GtrA family protein [Paludibacteraceae bacterium]|nr:GtrA family protein [Paludibacteraceae bacterium]
MRLPTSYLPDKPRSAVRFMVVGFTGSILQTWFFMAALWALGQPEKGLTLYYVAFAIGFILEMIPNYLMSNYYTFGTRPNKKNASGFLLSRAINIVVQFCLLPLMIRLLPSWRDDYISLLVIFIGGVINYFICLIFFKKKETDSKE